jgi:hypothetical protein
LDEAEGADARGELRFLSMAPDGACFVNFLASSTSPSLSSPSLSSPSLDDSTEDAELISPS